VRAAFRRRHAPIVATVRPRGTLTGMSDATPPADVSTYTPMRFRRLRIAVSVCFGVVTVALCVLWVRSYWFIDRYGSDKVCGRSLILASTLGHVTVGIRRWPNGPIPHDMVGLAIQSTDGWQMVYKRHGPLLRSYTFPTYFAATHQGFVAPHWAFAITFAIVAFAPWAKFIGPPLSARFSLRALLFAMTLVAVVLGLIVWAGR